LASDYPALLANSQGLGDIQMNRKLGFIGLGNMGLPMSINLLKANYEVYGFDTNAKAVELFTEAGGIGLESAKDVAKQCDVVMTSLPTPQITY